MDDLLTESQLHTIELNDSPDRDPVVERALNDYLDKKLDAIESQIIDQENARAVKLEFITLGVLFKKSSPQTLIYLTYLMASFDEFIEGVLHFSRNHLNGLIPLLGIRTHSVEVPKHLSNHVSSF